MTEKKLKYAFGTKETCCEADLFDTIEELIEIMLYSIEDCDIPEDKLKTAKHLLMPLKDFLLRDE